MCCISFLLAVVCSRNLGKQHGLALTLQRLASLLQWPLPILARRMWPMANLVSRSNAALERFLVRILAIMAFDLQCPMLKVWRSCSLCMQCNSTPMQQSRFVILFAFASTILMQWCPTSACYSWMFQEESKLFGVLCGRQINSHFSVCAMQRRG